jgi:hypothetical protein
MIRIAIDLTSVVHRTKPIFVKTYHDKIPLVNHLPVLPLNISKTALRSNAAP